MLPTRAWPGLRPGPPLYLRTVTLSKKSAIDLQGRLACVFGWVRWSVRRFFHAAPRPGEEVEVEEETRRMKEGGVTRATLLSCVCTWWLYTSTVGLVPLPT
jgi:hypothetical protein